MILNIVNHLRDIFKQFRSEEEQISLSRKAFFQMVGYVGSCMVISLLVQKEMI
ncbi:Mco6p SCDLUD_002634 [Saccharomycodes ludwigii]|uniref:Mco6p n=1 Tax=Saccharomycodes ludwigii TaxID=36035 RepID=UPI001E8ABD43|nr:hypothetical protein SCDLUD_002634 [Saccharomycodes ludwigii]KAH3901151.1 hypothetical protein SCDLUD_002634 [Saccharomycodes ludwigii]